MVELRGSLSGIGLPALVQLLGELHQTGRLELSNDRWTAQLGFDHGDLVDARFDHERGLEALAACMLTLADGEFSFIEHDPPIDRSIRLSRDELRAQLGELSSAHGIAGSLIPSLEAVPRMVAADGHDPAEHLVLERSALQILLLVDGRRTVREIIGARPLVPA